MSLCTKFTDLNIPSSSCRAMTSPRERISNHPGIRSPPLRVIGMGGALGKIHYSLLSSHSQLSYLDMLRPLVHKDWIKGAENTYRHIYKFGEKTPSSPRVTQSMEPYNRRRMRSCRGNTNGTDSCGHGCEAGFVCQLKTSFEGCSPDGATLKDADDGNNDDKDDDSGERCAAGSTNPCQGLYYYLEVFLAERADGWTFRLHVKSGNQNLAEFCGARGGINLPPICTIP